MLLMGGNWNDATRDLHDLRCPKCRDDRQIEVEVTRREVRCFCNTCAHVWTAPREIREVR